MSPPLKIYLIRHGETAWSLSGRHTGVSDVALTPHGEAMARQLTNALQGIDFSLVLTSPRLRARQTCELAGLGARAHVDPSLAEWDYGQWEGLRSAEIIKLQPTWDIWTEGCAGGEAPEDIGTRADQLIARLRDLSGNVVLFSHGHFGRVLAARWIGLPVAQGQHFALDPASVSVLGFEARHPERRVIARWNAAS
ncbi:MAG: histidine phosphatase family protein [Pseudorhodobacter sp.]|nr:histidine phosphatase family protein [Rhizobacter sp.]